MSDMRRVPGILLIGSAGRNAGKTEFACRLIEHFRGRHSIIGLKVTVIRENDGMCPRGGRGCGVCSSLAGHYDISEENSPTTGKDTSRLLAAGAARVLWLRVLKSHLVEGMAELLAMIGEDALCICESNSLRASVEPGLFLMIQNAASGEYKKTAEAVKHYADRIVLSEDGGFDVNIDDIEVLDGGWVLRERATAVILAGGDSRRMGTDKTLLPVDGRPMIERVCRKLTGTCEQVIVSANDAARYKFLGLRVVPDRAPGRGPLMGIASALEASDHELNVVIAGDMPGVETRHIHRLLQEVSDDCDAVVPMGDNEQLEPLFAVYRRGLSEKMFELVRGGKRRVREILAHCRVKYVELPDASAIRNLNTMADYEEYTGR